MTPDILPLARQVAALPGAPAIPRVFGVHRDGRGILWLSDKDDDESMGAVPDLTDAATGGVMLAALGPVTGTARDRTLWTTGDYEHQGDGPTLAAACARVMVARGRWA